MPYAPSARRSGSLPLRAEGSGLRAHDVEAHAEGDAELAGVERHEAHGGGHALGGGEVDGGGEAHRLLACEAGAAVVAVCGRRALDDAQLREVGIEAGYALTDVEPDPERCMTEAAPLLERLGERLAAAHLSPR